MLVNIPVWVGFGWLLSTELGLMNSLSVFSHMIEQIKHGNSSSMDLHSKIFSSSCLNPQNIQSTDKGSQLCTHLLYEVSSFDFFAFFNLSPLVLSVLCWWSRCFLLPCETDSDSNWRVSVRCLLSVCWHLLEQLPLSHNTKSTETINHHQGSFKEKCRI